MELALFDFDGTITTKDSFIPFLRIAAGRTRTSAAMAGLAPLIAAYKGGLLHASTMRQAAAFSALSGSTEKRVRELGESYCRSTLTQIVRPEAERRLAWHAERGHQIVVVSASLAFYLEPWCRDRGVRVLCNRIRTRAGRLTGRYAGPDCSGREKARRVKGSLRLESFSRIYAYGDSSEDDELLSLADESYRDWR